MEQETLDIINSLNISDEQKQTLIEKFEWEKELSWSDGYATCEEQSAYAPMPEYTPPHNKYERLEGSVDSNQLSPDGHTINMI